jgi:nitric oxide reductase large subunit
MPSYISAAGSYFTGQGTLNMGLTACFSAMEVVPLTLLTLDAWDFIKLRKAQCSACGHDLAWGQKWSIYFLMAVGVWNFIGAGIFGFLINLPIMSYFEVGTSLTPNHGHAALFGVFGMLALAVLVFCLRAMQSDATWKETEKFIRVGFWGANVGLALMIILDLFPGGVIQLWDSISNGYWHARRLTFLMGGTSSWNGCAWWGIWSSSSPAPCPSRSARCAVCGKGISLPRRKGCTTPGGVCPARGVPAGSANGRRCPKDGLATELTNSSAL